MSIQVSQELDSYYRDLIAKLIEYTKTTIVEKYVEENVVYVSDLAKCIYAVYLSMREKRNDYSSLLIGQFGHLIVEKALKHYLPDNDIEVKVEHEVEQEYNGVIVRGKIDVLIIDYDKLNSVPIELKFTKFKKIHLWYSTQLQLYMWLIGAKFGYLVYVDPQDLSYTIYTITYNDAIVKNRLKKVKDLLMVYKGIEPEREYFGCEICPFKNQCFNLKLFL